MEAIECNINSDWLNLTVKLIRSCVTFKFTNRGDREKKVLENGW